MILPRPPDFVRNIPDFVALNVGKPKTVSFGNKILLFFPVKAEMLLFSNLNKGGHQGGQGGRYFDLKFENLFIFVKIETKFQSIIASPLSPLVSPFVQI